MRLPQPVSDRASPEPCAYLCHKEVPLEKQVQKLLGLVRELGRGWSVVAKVRVYELAKEFGVESRAVMVQLQEMGAFVRSASSTIEEPVVRQLRERFAARAAGYDRGSARSGPANVITTRWPGAAVNDIGSEEAFLASIDETIKYFKDGDTVRGTVVEVRPDEVLVDIGYKTEGVIFRRELSTGHEVKVGDRIEAVVLQKEDREGRLILSGNRAGGGRDPRDAVPARPPASASELPGSESMRELFDSWDVLRKQVPVGEDSVSFLADRSGLRRAAVHQVRTTRNRCAHPGADGWPGPYDVDMAVATARELLRRLKIPRQNPPRS